MDFLFHLMIERVNKSLNETEEKELPCEERQKRLELILKAWS